MKAIDNSGLLEMCYNGCTGSTLAPSVAYAYDPEAQTVTITDSSDYGDADLKVMHMYVSDANGDVKTAKLITGETVEVVDVSDLDPFDGFNIRVTIVTTERKIVDLSAYKVGSTAPDEGDLRNKNTSH